MRGLIIQCAGCGLSKMISLDGNAGEINTEVKEAINEGWRYASNKQEFICPCCTNVKTIDPIYTAYCGAPKLRGKKESYTRLLKRATEQLRLFIELDRF